LLTDRQREKQTRAKTFTILPPPLSEGITATDGKWTKTDTQTWNRFPVPSPELVTFVQEPNQHLRDLYQALNEQVLVEVPMVQVQVQVQVQVSMVQVPAVQVQVQVPAVQVQVQVSMVQVQVPVVQVQVQVPVVQVQVQVSMVQVQVPMVQVQVQVQVPVVQVQVQVSMVVKYKYLWFKYKYFGASYNNSRFILRVC